LHLWKNRVIEFAVKFILNVSVDPHFCAVFDAHDMLLRTHSWEDRKRDGEEVFSFLSTLHLETRPISFLGGVSGPGGFSSLRVGATILHALAFRFQLPIHQVRSEVWIQEFLKEREITPLPPIFLNSFGSSLFVFYNNNLVRLEKSLAHQQFLDVPVFLECLPEEKKEGFVPVRCPFLETETSLLRVLTSAPAQTSFFPAYEFPPV